MKKIELIIALVMTMCGLAGAAETTAFDAVLEHYEPVRKSLIDDSMAGVNDHGRAIAEELRALEGDFSAERAGVSGEAAEMVREQLDEMIAAADSVASATSLEAARDGLYALSKSLVRWRQGLSETSRPVVAYCPMHKRSWLQPSGEVEIGNPYGGMPRCGEIVSK